jgi:hypothetical protein
MNIEPIPPALALLASVVFALIPLQRARVRAAWAKAIFPMVAIVGVALSSVRLVNLRPPAGFQQVRPLLCGFALGLIVALILSRQLLGQKRQTNPNGAS